MSTIVTGGASGIGSAAADRLRGAGHDVITWDLRGGDIACDISDPEAVSAALGKPWPVSGCRIDWSPVPVWVLPEC